MNSQSGTENGTGVTHDPLCPRPRVILSWKSKRNFCICGFLAQARHEEREDMLAKCIAALPHSTYCLDTWYDDKTSECFCESAACDRTLRALQEKP
jgi:hypothetical protein